MRRVPPPVDDSALIPWRYGRILLVLFVALFFGTIWFFSTADMVEVLSGSR